ncbi:MAG: SurA N-terminal domain-containing protein [Deltaproteobacteria bacterium]|nr:SurA N-terminal domain-containing protein [Deltaproteobacteria bacterium]MBW2393335.1 SurA N-terminal domain-containing protein [Deltaproteobacteria bacterium]
MRLLSALLFVTLVLAGPAHVDAEMIDGIAAQVGSEIVLVSDIMQAAGPAESRIREDGGGNKDVAMLHLEILEHMIERALVRQIVKRAELSASDGEVDASIADIARENQLTVEELRASVDAQGMPFEVYRERIRGEIEHQKVMSGMVASKVRLGEAEIREVYDQEFTDQPVGGEEFYLRQLMVAFPDDQKNARTTACMRVGAARARIQSGESFRDVASEVSEVNPEVGGTIGWLHEGEVAAWMLEAIGNLEPGDVSDVVEAPFGCNLIEVVERRPFEKITWEQARKPLEAQLFEQRMAEEYKNFIERIREQTYIERKGMFADSADLDFGQGSGSL